MVERLFPRALVACIGEGRTPEPQELATMIDKVWHEAFPQHSECSGRRQATNVARTALAGDQLTV